MPGAKPAPRRHGRGVARRLTRPAGTDSYSALPYLDTWPTLRAMTEGDIADLIAAYASCKARGAGGV